MCRAPVHTFPQTLAFPQPEAVPSTRREPVTLNDVQRVHTLIECCLKRFMDVSETVSALAKLGVEDGFTRIVWQKLEDQNPQFFREYNLKLALKEHLLHMSLA